MDVIKIFIIVLLFYSCCKNSNESSLQNVKICSLFTMELNNKLHQINYDGMLEPEYKCTQQYQHIDDSLFINLTIITLKNDQILNKDEFYNIDINNSLKAIQKANPTGIVKHSMIDYSNKFIIQLENFSDQYYFNKSLVYINNYAFNLTFGYRLECGTFTENELRNISMHFKTQVKSLSRN